MALSPADFMARVVPWPTAGEGVINLHWTFADRANPNIVAKGVMGGKPFSTLADLLGFIPWANGRPGLIKDLYFCLSQQAETSPLVNGKLKAVRLAANATALKAVWFDLDGNKPDPKKGYPTKDAALDALVKFCSDASLPFPNAIVDSGNGLHPYWISDRALSVDEWRMYAQGLWALAQKHGLVADPVTTDAARILRVPGTWNNKSVPPKPVTLVRLEPEYDFKSSLGALIVAQAQAPVQALPRSNTKPSSLMINPALFPKKASVTTDRLAPDCVRPEVVLDVISVAEQCPHFRDALLNGGKDHNQGLWMQTVLASTWMEDPLKVAHRVSYKHSGYVASDTDAMFARKMADREQRGLGWPSCTTFENNGCKLCATCIHKGKIRSPLNLGKPIVPPAAAAAAAIAATADPAAFAAAPPPPPNDLFLPKKYAINAAGHICYKKAATGPDTGETWPELFRCVITDPGIEKGDRPSKDRLSFTNHMDADHSHRVEIKYSDLASTQTLTAALTNQSVLLHHPERERLADFMEAWIETLRKRIKAQENIPFGWWMKDGVYAGFAYGGKLYKADGTTAPSTTGDWTTKVNFTPVGSAAPWHEAAKLVFNQKRPSIEIIVAAAFAAPLLKFTGREGCTLIAKSQGGHNKTTAAQLGKAVWGHPKNSGETSNASALGIQAKVGEIQNLPYYWDDVREPKNIADAAVIVHQLSEGKSGSKAKRDGKARETPEWQTMLTICSNKSIFDKIVEKHQDDTASLMRILEYEVEDPPPGTPGRHPDKFEPGRIMSKLYDNFGRVGEDYAQVLATNADKINAKIAMVSKRFSARVDPHDDERYWVTMCTILLVGAELATMLGVPFHLKEMEDYLEAIYRKMRRRIGMEAVDGSKAENAEFTLQSYLSAHPENMIWTHHLPPRTQGRVSLKELPFFGPAKDREILIRFAVDQRMLLIARPPFLKWLRKELHTPSTIMEGLEKFMHMEMFKESISRGTTFDLGRNFILNIPIKDGTWLGDVLYSKVSASEVPLTHSHQSAPSPGALSTGLSPPAQTHHP